MNINNLTEFNELIKKNKIVIVDFYTDWCGPCKMLAPIMQQVGEELEKMAVVAKVNVDVANDLSDKFDIKTIPTVMYFVNGVVKEQFIGYRTKAQVLDLFKKIA